MNKFFAVLLAAAVGLLAGCAASGGGNAAGTDAAGAPGNSGITVFGTVDAAISHTKTR